MTSECIGRLIEAGISRQDACALRRISMTLHRWFELECGDGNNYASWCITRGRKLRNVHEYDDSGRSLRNTFEYADDGKPFIERHVYAENKARYEPIVDREKGARKRLEKVMERYPALVAYIQTDPRGCALYVLRKADLGDSTADQVYNSRGIAVYM